MNYPECEKLKTMKVLLRLDAVTAYLHECVILEMPLRLMLREAAVERLVAADDREAVQKFVDWLKSKLVYDTLYVPGVRCGVDHDEILYPSEQLYAAYAGIDLDIVEREREVILAELRARHER